MHPGWKDFNRKQGIPHHCFGLGRHPCQFPLVTLLQTSLVTFLVSQWKHLLGVWVLRYWVAGESCGYWGLDSVGGGARRMQAPNNGELLLGEWSRRAGWDGREWQKAGNAVKREQKGCWEMALRGLWKGDLTMSFPFVSQMHSEHLLEKKMRNLCLCMRSSCPGASCPGGTQSTVY